MKTDLLKDDHGKENKRIKTELNNRLSLFKDWQDTLNTPHVRRVLMDLLDNTFMYDSVFTGNAKTYYNAAFQDYGQKILDTLASADPDTFLWVHAQRANYLKRVIDDEVDALKNETV